MKGLPIYNITLLEEDGVDKISFVEHPAVERDFLKFNENAAFRFSVDNEERRIVTGLIATPDIPIYRNQPPHGEHYVVFSKEVIMQMVQRYFTQKNTDAVNLDHSQNVAGVFMFESYIKDTARGIAPKEFPDVPDGSWFGSFKVANDDVWDQIKKGKYNGFSIEGFLSYEEPEITDLETLLNQISL